MFVVIGFDATGSHVTIVRVVPNCTGDLGSDSRRSNGTAYRIHDIDDAARTVGFTREANGNQAVPSVSVVQIPSGHGSDVEPAFMFQYSLNPRDVILPPHDYRDNFSGGFAFANHQPGMALPQQPWSS